MDRILILTPRLHIWAYAKKALAGVLLHRLREHAWQKRKDMWSVLEEAVVSSKGFEAHPDCLHWVHRESQVKPKGWEAGHKK